MSYGLRSPISATVPSMSTRTALGRVRRRRVGAGGRGVHSGTRQRKAPAGQVALVHPRMTSSPTRVAGRGRRRAQMHSSSGTSVKSRTTTSRPAAQRQLGELAHDPRAQVGVVADHVDAGAQQRVDLGPLRHASPAPRPSPGRARPPCSIRRRSSRLTRTAPGCSPGPGGLARAGQAPGDGQRRHGHLVSSAVERRGADCAALSRPRAGPAATAAGGSPCRPAGGTGSPRSRVADRRRARTPCGPSPSGRPRHNRRVRRLDLGGGGLHLGAQRRGDVADPGVELVRQRLDQRRQVAAGRQVLPHRAGVEAGDDAVQPDVLLILDLHPVRRSRQRGRPGPPGWRAAARPAPRRGSRTASRSTTGPGQPGTAAGPDGCAGGDVDRAEQHQVVQAAVVEHDPVAPGR